MLDGGGECALLGVDCLGIPGVSGLVISRARGQCCAQGQHSSGANENLLECHFSPLLLATDFRARRSPYIKGKGQTFG